MHRERSDSPLVSLRSGLGGAHRVISSLAALLAVAITTFAGEVVASATCLSNADCTDPCETGQCNLLSHSCTMKAVGDPCDTDGDLCNGTGTCNARLLCTIGSAPREGTACNDGNVCNGTDTCGRTHACSVHSGNASSTTQCGSAHDGVCQLHDHCDGSGTCVAGTIAASTVSCGFAHGTCQAHDHCSGTDATCSTGAFFSSTTQCGSAHGACQAHDHCTGTNAVCETGEFFASTTQCGSAHGSCQAHDHCTGADAACETGEILPASTQCGSAHGLCQAHDHCTGTDTTCATGALASSGTICGGPSAPCYTLTACDGNGTCVASVAMAPGASCDDGNLCNGTDTCDASHTCVHTDPLPTNASCSDGNPCNGDERCAANQTCTPGTPLATGALCRRWPTCTGVDSHCTSDHQCPGPFQVTPEGTSCDDGNPCNGAEACDGNTRCVSGDPPAAGTVCGYENNDLCQGELRCDGIRDCRYDGNLPVLDDGNPCTGDYCANNVGVYHVPEPSSTMCPDGNVCNGTEHCDGASHCVAGSPLAAGADCSDGDPCDGNETCDGLGACHVTSSYDDGDPCTADTCTGQTVQHTPVVVDDGNPCTADACDATGLVTHVPTNEGGSCVVSSACSGTSTCQAGACVPSGTNNGSTESACDPNTGAITTVPVLGACAHTLDTTVSTYPKLAGAYLYTCSPAIQTGVTASTFADGGRVSLVHGKVLSSEGQPVPGVSVTVVDHPELGATLTRADGAYDLNVVTGGSLTFAYAKAGADQAHAYVPSHRTVPVRPATFVAIPDVRMTLFDPAVTAVTLGGAMQHARGTQQSDGNGVRQATVLVPSGTQATMTVNGVVQALPSTVHIRATEFTVGEHGPDLMPASLPPASAYTYAVELSLDEASDPGAEVQFSLPPSDPGYATWKGLPFYVENFRGFPVGSPVPLGFYDRKEAAWKAMPNGRVVEIVGYNGAYAELDVTGDGNADTGSALSDLGITDDERARLAILYPPATVKKDFWRVSVPHFSSWDCNWPHGPDPNGGGGDGGDDGDAGDDGSPPPAPAPPPPPPAPIPPNPKEPSCTDGSIIGCETQTLGERISVPGAPFELVYESDRARGYAKDDTIHIQLRPEMAPPSAIGVAAEATVAGQTRTWAFSLQEAPATVEWTWDRRDGDGRLVEGTQVAQVRVGYTYRTIYYRPAGLDVAFATPGETPFNPPAEPPPPTTLWREYPVAVGGKTPSDVGLGGWGLSVHHSYEPSTQSLWLGSGARINAADTHGMISTYLGGPEADQEPYPPSLTPHDARYWQFGTSDMAVCPDGTVYVAGGSFESIERVDSAAGTVTCVAGCSDPPSASSTPVDPLIVGFLNVAQIACDAKNRLVFSEEIDGGNNRIRRIEADGLAHVIACDGGQTSLSGDGGPAVDASCPHIDDMAIGSDGSILIVASSADQTSSRVRRIDPGGTMTTLLGGSAVLGAGSPDPDLSTGLPVPATSTAFEAFVAVGIAPSGEAFALEGNRVWRVPGDGTAVRVAGTQSTGTGTFPAGSAGTPAISTKLNLGGGFLRAPSMAIDSTGHILLPESAVGAGNHPARIRSVTPGGEIVTVAQGDDTEDYPVTSPQSGYAAYLSGMHGLTMAEDGSLLYFDQTGVASMIRRLSGTGFPSLGSGQIQIPSSDGSEIYVFTSDGKHLWTLSANVLSTGGGVASQCDNAPLAAGSGVRLFEFCYDVNGLLLTVYDRDGLPTTIDRSSSEVDLTSSHGVQTTIGWDDTAGVVRTIGHADGKTAHFDYQVGTGLMTSFVNFEGHAHAFAYDDVGRLLTDRDAKTPQPGPAYKNLARTETSTGWKVDVTLPEESSLGTPTTHELQRYEADGVKPIGREISLTYAPGTIGHTIETDDDGTRIESFGAFETRTDVMAADPRFGMAARYPATTTTTLQGHHGNLTQVVTRTRESDGTNPTDWNTLTSKTTLDAKTWTTTFTRSTQTQVTSSPTGRTTTAVFDAQLRPTTVTVDGLEPIHYSYDDGRLAAVGQCENIASGCSRLTQLAYDPVTHFLSSITDANGDTTGFQPDVLGRPGTTTLPDTSTMTMIFDGNDNLVSLSPPGREPHQMPVDDVDLMAQYDPPLLAGTTATNTVYDHDRDRRLTNVHRPDGRIAQYDYDSVSRPSHVYLPGSEGTLARTYTNTSTAGLLGSESGPGAETLYYSYDGLRLGSVTWSGPTAGAVDVTRDNTLRIQSDSVSAGAATSSVTYGYDDDGLLLSAEDPSSGETWSMTRDVQNGLITNAKVAHGATDQLTEAFDYTDATAHKNYGEIHSYALTSGATSLYSLVLERDVLGRVTKKTETSEGVTHVYEYAYGVAGQHNVVGRLYSEKKDGVLTTYDYDANGNRTKVNGSTLGITIDEQDRLTAYDGVTFTVDANGDRTHSSAGDSWTYDTLGHLRSATVGGNTVTYELDARGRRVGRSLNGTPTDKWLYFDQTRLAAQLDGSGVMKYRFVYATGRHVPDLAIDPSSGAVYRLVTDQVGSLRLVVRASDGHVMQRVTYGSAWGEGAVSVPDAGFTPLGIGFAGGLFDGTTRLVHFGAREYDAVTARWTNKDPILLAGGANLYVYAGDEPVSRVDASGLMPGDGYPTRDAAAIAAFEFYGPISVENGQEYGGQLYQRPDGQYSYGIADAGGDHSVNALSPEHVTSLDCPGSNVVGIYHTHGGFPSNPGDGGWKYFSPNDIDNARDGAWSFGPGFRSYLGTPDGGIQTFQPDPSGPGGTYGGLGSWH